MKIEKKRIKKFVGSAALMTALTLGGIVAINEHSDLQGFKAWQARLHSCNHKECKEQQDGQEGYYQGRVSDRVIRPRYPWIYWPQYHCKCDKGWQDCGQDGA